MYLLRKRKMSHVNCDTGGEKSSFQTSNLKQSVGLRIFQLRFRSYSVQQQIRSFSIHAFYTKMDGRSTICMNAFEYLEIILVT